MSQIDKWAHFIAQLIERTQDRRVEWSSYIPKQSDAASAIDVVYQTKYADKALRLYKAKRAVDQSPFWSAVSPAARDEIVLKIVDQDQKEVWAFPESPALVDLLTAVKYQVAKVDDFLEGLLKQ
jgi:hypothetical protein